MGSEGRRSSAYRRVSAEYRTGNYPCHYGCGRPGLTVDHIPPLSEFPHHTMWQGKYLPACPTCQSRQGARITNERKGVARPTSRQW